MHPVLLCGGSGTRLWPLSRKSFPRHFTALTGNETLFQAGAGVAAGPGPVPFTPDLRPARIGAVDVLP